MTKKYDDIIAKAPNPEIADKIMCAMYILTKGQSDVVVQPDDITNLIKSMSLEELKRNAQKVKEKKYER